MSANELNSAFDPFRSEKWAGLRTDLGGKRPVKREIVVPDAI